MTRSVKNPPSKLRIIGGQWRGRKLAFPDLPGLRPTGDRIRETLFNWLQGELLGAHCLDLFAGSGALGFEAVSRGAASAVLLEQQGAAAKYLVTNCQVLGTAAIAVLQEDALAFLAKPAPRQFQLVFMDPPFAADVWQTACDRLVAGQWLAPGAWIYLESPRHMVLNAPLNWRLHRQQCAGQVAYCLYQAAAEQSRVDALP